MPPKPAPTTATLGVPEGPKRSRAVGLIRTSMTRLLDHLRLTRPPDADLRRRPDKPATRVLYMRPRPPRSGGIGCHVLVSACGDGWQSWSQSRSAARPRPRLP